MRSIVLLERSQESMLVAQVGCEGIVDHRAAVALAKRWSDGTPALRPWHFEAQVGEVHRRSAGGRIHERSRGLS